MSNAAIVCVDDEEIILKSLGNQLRRNLGKKYDIELVNNAQEALQLCDELENFGTKVALVISDQRMSGMSGDEFLIRLHSAHPNILKILLTGQAEAQSVGNVVNEASLYRYISKPWDETDLILTVKEALRRYGQEKRLAEQNKLLKKNNALLKNTNDKLNKSLEMLLSTFETSNDGILALDDNEQAIIFNQQFITLLNLDPLKIEQDGNKLLSLITNQLKEPAFCELNFARSDLKRPQYDILKLQNNSVIESYFCTQQLNGSVVGIVWGFRDVTERERVKAIAEYRAQLDTLTQLPKRSILQSKLATALTTAKSNSQMAAVMFVDLDRFRIISDTLGHQISDNLLKVVVQRLKDCIQSKDLIACWSRSEFTILLPQITGQSDTDAIARKILDAFKTPFSIGQKPIYINIHIGIALYPQHGHRAETILEKADAALTQARQFGSNHFQYYSLALNSQAHKLFTLENQLHSALANNELTLYYQPIVNIFTGQIVKMEALLRWNNPQLGLLLPDNFIPLAEANGAIIAIGEWVLQTVCTQGQLWQSAGFTQTKIVANLSVRQLQQPNLVNSITQILAMTQLPATALELEITESIMVQNTELAQSIMGQLNRLGISLSMDDFGTGYSPLGYLRQFPFQTLKIDKSLIKDLKSDPQDIAIINAVIALGAGLNLNVVAEGVETVELRDLLANLGCEYVQGYLFSHPLPASEATKLLTQNYQELSLTKNSTQSNCPKMI